MKVLALAALCCLIAVSSYAQPTNLDKAEPPPPQTGNKATNTKKINKDGKVVQPTPTPLPPNISITVGGKLELSSEMKEAKAPEEKKGGFGEFLNLKLTDIVIAVFTVVIGIYTIFLTMATRNLATISGEQERSTKTIERAYVKMSHTEEGLYIWRNETVRMCKVTVRIENCGRTPASVIDIRLNRHLLAYGDPLPAIPDYGDAITHGAPFLVPADSFCLRDKTFPLGHLDAPNPADGAIRFCLFGRIVYIDAFGKTHCAGYAREYLPRTREQSHSSD